MDNNKLVSVIIPVHNVSSFLTETLDSITDQTYRNIEIMIVDDGSTDGSGEVCDKYAEKDKRIRVIHQKNGGLSAARNTGLDSITGDVVAFLDSDDAYCVDYIEKMLRAMVREKADVTICRYATLPTTKKMVRTGEEEIRPPLKQGIYGRKEVLQMLAYGLIDHTVWNKMYSRNLWTSIRFPNGHVYEDVDTTFRILNLSNTVIAIDEPLYLKRKHKDSITETRSRENIDDWILAFSHFEDFIVANIPALFSADHLNQCMRTQFRKLIGYYVFNAKNGTGDGINEGLRDQIMCIGNAIDVSKEEFRVQAYFYMIRFIPWSLSIVKLFVNPVRQISKLISR